MEFETMSLDNINKTMDENSAQKHSERELKKTMQTETNDSMGYYGEASQDLTSSYGSNKKRKKPIKSLD